MPYGLSYGFLRAFATHPYPRLEAHTMKSTTLLSSVLSAILSTGIAASALVGCAADPAVDSSFPGTIKQESAAAFANPQLCDVETPCSAGLECMFVEALGIDSAICVDSATVCQALDCGDGECLVLESYPAQLMCSGSPDSGDGDDGVDDSCSISSDGSMVCPEPGDGSDGDSEPGDPGPA